MTTTPTSSKIAPAGNQPCPRCAGRGYLTEDPAPDCPSVAPYETAECPACEGSGEAATADEEPTPADLWWAGKAHAGRTAASHPRAGR